MQVAADIGSGMGIRGRINWSLTVVYVHPIHAASAVAIQWRSLFIQVCKKL